MKVNKYIIGMFVATATFFVSCNTDNERDIYNLSLIHISSVINNKKLELRPISNVTKGLEGQTTGLLDVYKRQGIDGLCGEVIRHTGSCVSEQSCHIFPDRSRSRLHILYRCDDEYRLECRRDVYKRQDNHH